VAIALNLMIVSAILVPWIVFGLDQGEKLSALFSLVISFNLTLLLCCDCSTARVPADSKAGTLVTGTVGAVILFPGHSRFTVPLPEKISWSVAVYTLCLGVDRTCQCHQHFLALLSVEHLNIVQLADAPAAASR